MLKETIVNAGKDLKTLIINYTEKDGSNEGEREVEPYGFKEAKNGELLMAYDIKKRRHEILRNK